MTNKCKNYERNLSKCNCLIECDKKGICCDCIAFHRKLNQVPACLKDVVEKIIKCRKGEKNAKI